MGRAGARAQHRTTGSYVGEAVKELIKFHSQKSLFIPFALRHGPRRLSRLAYLVAENRILRAYAPNQLRLSNEERSTLAEIGRRLGRKSDGSKDRSYPGRPRTAAAVEALIVHMARENSGLGYDRIAGALAHLGHEVSDQTVGNVLYRHGIAPAPKRSQTTITWKDFLTSHIAVLSGMDFFTAEVLTCRGLATYDVLFVIQLETRQVSLVGISRHPTEEWDGADGAKPDRR